MAVLQIGLRAVVIVQALVAVAERRAGALRDSILDRRIHADIVAPDLLVDGPLVDGIPGGHALIDGVGAGGAARGADRVRGAPGARVSVRGATGAARVRNTGRAARRVERVADDPDGLEQHVAAPRTRTTAT